jgi:hypothetical protein
MREIVFTDIIDECKTGLSSQQVADVLRKPSKEVFLADGKEVDFASFQCGIHVKTFGAKENGRYTVIVLTTAAK